MIQNCWKSHGTGAVRINFNEEPRLEVKYIAHCQEIRIFADKMFEITVSSHDHKPPQTIINIFIFDANSVINYEFFPKQQQTTNNRQMCQSSTRMKKMRRIRKR